MGQRNAPAVLSDAGNAEAYEELQHPEQWLDAEMGHAGEQQPDVAETLTDLENGRDGDRSMTEAWSLMEAEPDAARQSSNPGPTSSDSDAEDTQPGPNSFACDYPGCTKSYARRSRLHHHQRMHIPQGDRPFVCWLCIGPTPPRFQYQKDLDKHFQSLQHSERRFACDRCRKMFTRNDNRNRHQRGCQRAVPP